MDIALYGPYLFELAVGLRENPTNNVRLFLDESSLPRSLLTEPLLHDRSFAEIGRWITRKTILRPNSSELAKRFDDFDVALVTELGPIIASRSTTKFVFIPTGWDLTCAPFPVRSRSTRQRGLGDVSSALIAERQRKGILAAVDIWTSVPFAPWTLAAERLGVELSNWLPQPIDTCRFRPARNEDHLNTGSGALRIVHPSRMMFTQDRFLIETGQYKRNDMFVRGFSRALDQGIDAHLVVVERASSPDQVMMKEVIEDLGVSDRIEWLNAGTPAGFTWGELADLYRSADLVADEFGGWFGLVSLEGAASGKPVLNCVDLDLMNSMYPNRSPFIQTTDEGDVCDAISMLTDPQVRRTIGESSRQWLLANHDRKVVTRRCESMLKELGLT